MFLNLLRMIKKQVEQINRRLLVLIVELIKLLQLLWTRLSSKKRGWITTRQHLADDTMIDSFQNPWHLACLPRLLLNCNLNWTFLTWNSDLSKPVKSCRPTISFFNFIIPEIRKLVTQITKWNLLELRLTVGFTNVFIKPNFKCSGDIRT